MIKGIILDIDGVIVGEKIGVNSPNPHPLVIKAMRSVSQKGIFISLCTAKPHFSIRNIIQQAKLDNYHITDGGGVIINPVKNKIVKKFVIDSDIAKRIIDLYIKNNVYVEYYTVDNYMIQQDQTSDITEKHKHVLQQDAKVVENLTAEALKEEITKIMPIAINEIDKERVTKLFEPFKDKLMLSWGIHPVALPLQFGIITSQGVSKKQGALEISKSTGIPFHNILGVGDSDSDWQFIELCKYRVAMGNANDKLKELVESKGEDYSFIAPTVDENGILEVFSKFQLS